jgi:outer membrane usher protein FimD/PapC
VPGLLPQRQRFDRSNVVGDGDQVYLSDMAPQGGLPIKWGNGEQCRINYQLSDNAPTGNVSLKKEICQ